MNHGLFYVNALNKSKGICIPATIIIGSPDITHWSAADHALGKVASVGDAVGVKSDYNEETIKTIFKFEWEIPNFNSSSKSIERSQTPLDSTHFGSKTLYEKTRIKAKGYVSLLP